MSRIKVDRITNRAGTGDPLFPNGISVVGLTSLSNVIAGVATFSNVTIGGTITYDDVTNIDSVGLITARSGIVATGVVTATSFVGDGSGLTNAGPSLTGSTNNTIVTVTGANALAGEPKFTYDGTNLKLQQTVSGGYNEFIQDANPSSEGGTLGYLSGYWNTERVADIRFAAGDDTSNKNNAHICFRTTNEGQGNVTDRLRIGNFGQIGLPVGPVGTAATDWGATGQVFTSGGSSAAPTWADAGGGAWEVIATHALTSGQSANIDNTGWSDAYQLYRVVLTGVNIAGGNMGLWVRWYMSDNPSSTAAGTLQTSDKYHYHRSAFGNTSNTNVEADYHKLYNGSTPSHWDYVELDFPMTSYTGNYKKGSIAKYTFYETGMYQERAYWDHNTQEDYHIKGCRIHFPNGTTNLQGRVTFLRFKHA